MPIPVACKCGQKFAAKDQLAGKKVKCPKCSQPLTIPQPQPRRPAGSAAKPAASPAASKPAAASPDPFDDFGPAPVKGATCSSCGASMPPEGILCVQCGFNHKLGRHLQTMGSSGTARPKTAASANESKDSGHGGAANPLLRRAEQAMREDAEAKKKETSEGTPWWGYLIALCVVIGFASGMILLPAYTAFSATGGFLIFLGALLIIGGVIWMLVVAINENVLLGIVAVALLPVVIGLFYLFYFAVTRWERGGKAFSTTLLGVVVTAAGAGMLWIASLIGSDDKEPDLSMVRPPTVAVSTRSPFGP